MSDTPAANSTTSTPPPGPGTFVWNELNTHDRPDAAKFYGELFGWGLDHYSVPGAVPATVGSKDYDVGLDSSMFKIGNRHVGGLVTNPAPGAPPFWLSYVHVADLKATCAKVIELGGKIVLPMATIPNVGSIAVLQDRQGAFLGLFQA